MACTHTAEVPTVFRKLKTVGHSSTEKKKPWLCHRLHRLQMCWKGKAHSIMSPLFVVSSCHRRRDTESCEEPVPRPKERRNLLETGTKRCEIKTLKSELTMYINLCVIISYRILSYNIYIY